MARELGDVLGRAGYTGHVGACPMRMDVWSLRAWDANPPAPTAMLQFRLDPDREPAIDGQNLLAGSPDWNVRPADNHRLIQTVIGWAARIGDRGQIGVTEPSAPLIPADAADLIIRRQDDGPKTFPVQFTENAEDPLTRIRRIDFGLNGGLGVMNIDPRRDPLATAQELAEPIAELADILSAALVRPMDYNYLAWNHYSRRWDVLWRDWETKIYRPEGIQLMTQTQLDQTHDLSHWTITPLTTDRYLVQADDLAAWFNPPPGATWHTDPEISTSMRISDQVPGPQALAQARADFGAAMMDPAAGPGWT